LTSCSHRACPRRRCDRQDRKARASGRCLHRAPAPALERRRT
jgi:hypothetical protein